jgi:DUF917 family protein
MACVAPPLTIEASDVTALAIGCAVLGSGGGGDPTIGTLMAQEAMRVHGPVTIVDVDDLPADGIIMPCGFFGAPLVALEKLEHGGEGERLVAEVEAHTGQKVVAIMPYEIAGSNGVLPLTWAARLGLPYADADGMGRAFPTAVQMTMGLAQVDWSPAVYCDERFNTVVITGVSIDWTEKLLRAVAGAMGGAGVAAIYLMDRARAQEATVRGSVSRALRLGRAAQESARDPIAAIIRELGAVELTRGSIISVDRDVDGLTNPGSVIIQEGGAEGRILRLEIQHEILLALEGGSVRASVPDIITVLDAGSGEVIVTERLRYGQRVRVIAFPCDAVWRSDAGLALVGPRAFGYDVEYRPLEEVQARAS